MTVSRAIVDPPAGAATGSVSLCVAIQRSQASIARGQTARWVVTAWTVGGSASGATVRLVATPAKVSGKFNFGCGSHDGTGSCALGEMDATSAQRELQAQVVVPAADTSVTSVALKVIGSAASLPTDPQATVAIAVTAPTATRAHAAASGGGSGSVTRIIGPPGSGSTPLTIGNLPFLNGSPGMNGSNGTSSTLSPGGNAGGLFPTLTPSPQSSTAAPGQRASARPVADTSALPLGAPVVAAQLIGLGVLALAFVLAATRLSIRRRTVPATAGAATTGSARPAGGSKPGPADGNSQAGNPNKPADSPKPPSEDTPTDGDILNG